jgi:hypothetical protein
MNALIRLACHRTWPRIKLPAVALVALLQRTPAARVVALCDEVVTASPIGALLRSAAATIASLGALHSLAGATVLAPSVSGPVNATVGTAISPIAFNVTNTISIGSWQIDGSLPPGLSLVASEGGASLSSPGTLDATTMGTGGDPYDPYGGGSSGGISTTTPILQGTPTQAGSYTFTLRAFEFGRGTGGSLSGLASDTFSYTVNVAGGAASPPTFSAQPISQSVSTGASVTLTASASGSPTFKWQHNGSDISGASGASLTLANLQPIDTGIYTAVISNAGGTAASSPAVVGLSSSVKIIGTGDELGPNTIHPVTHFTYDQVLLTGPAATITADPDQITRISYIDLNDDIVQVEFSGHGSLSLVLSASSPPAPPARYNQPVNYMKGHAGIVITGADETTNVSVFSVGRGNAVNQALFRDDVTYDGVADIAFIAISSPNGKFGGVRTADASFFASSGYTGLYAAGVEFTGPVNIGDINASGTAIPVLRIGTGDSGVRITGGDLKQDNSAAVEVSGITQLLFTAGATSRGTTSDLPAQVNQGKLVDPNGTDVTSQIVVNP